jgi:hypothetical protein
MHHATAFMVFLRRLLAGIGARRVGAGLLVGLYLGRLLLEFAPPAVTGGNAALGFVLAAVIGTTVTIALVRLTGAAWPALLLLIYLLYPAISPEAAGVAGVLALVAWLTVRPAPGGWGWDVAIFLGAFAVYVATAAPGLLPADAGEFQVAVSELGVAHPPGYPLYTALGWMFSRLPLGDPAHRVNLFSALTAALTLALVGRAVRRETGAGPAGLVAALTLGAATSFWTTAAQASIRPMTALFVALLLEALLAYRRAAREKREHARRAALTRFALCLGLGLTHHLSIAFPAAVFVLALAAADLTLLRRLRSRRRWLKPGLAFAAGFLPWIYLPLRAGAVLAPGDINTWNGFWDYVLARGFVGDFFYFRTPEVLVDRLHALANVLTFQWHGLVLAMSVLAALVMLWRDRWLLATLGGAFAVHAAVAATYRAPQTVEYMTPAYVCLAVAVGWLVGEARGLSEVGTRSAVPLRLPRPYVVPLLTAVVILAGALSTATNWPSMVYLHGDEEARDFAQCLLDGAPEDAAILANWHRVTPLWYLQRVEGRRPDVEIVYVYPEGAEPLGETWARRVGEYLGERLVVVQSYYAGPYSATGYRFEPQPSGPGWVVRADPRTELPPGFAPLDVPFEGGMRLVGGPVMDSTGGYAPTTVTLAWRVDTPPGRDLTGFIHAVDASGRLVRQDDVSLPTGQAQPGEIILARYTLARLPSGSDLLAGLYASSADDIVAIPARDGRARVEVGQAREDAHDGAPAPFEVPLPPVSEHPRYDLFADGLILTGYDYDLSLPGRARLYLHWSYWGAGEADFVLTLGQGDVLLASEQFRASDGFHFTTAHDLPPDVEGVRLALEEAGREGRLRVLGPWGVPVGQEVDLPGPGAGDRYIPLGGGVVLTGVQVEAPGALTPGESVRVTLRFRAAYPLAEDDVVKLDLIGEGWAWRAQSDHVPAAGAIPTLKWMWGSAVTDRHMLIVPEAAADVPQARLALLLYDHFTGRPLPILDPALAARGQPLSIWGSGVLQ